MRQREREGDQPPRSDDRDVGRAARARAGGRRRSGSGGWWRASRPAARCPSIWPFIATSRIAAPIAPTASARASCSHAGWNCETTPEHRRLRRSARRAASRRRRPAAPSAPRPTRPRTARSAVDRPSRTHHAPQPPAPDAHLAGEAGRRLDARSAPRRRPPSANSSSSHSGAAPRSTESVIAAGSQFWAKRDHRHHAEQHDAEQRQAQHQRRAGRRPRPRTFWTATNSDRQRRRSRSPRRPRRARSRTRPGSRRSATAPIAITIR